MIGDVLLDNQFFVGIFSIAIFIQWIKLFYMMRIFAGTAHFITLINQVVKDISVFTIMLLICIFGFGSFFWVLSRTEPNDQQKLFGTYEKKPTVTDSFMSLYLTSLGDFSKADYYENANKNMFLNWFFFILMTFIVFIIFMNLLISIMGNTLNDVLLVENEAKIME